MMTVIEELRVRPEARRRAAPRPRRRVVRLAQPGEAAVLSCLHHSLARDTFLFEDSIAAGPSAGAVVLVCEVSEAIAGYLCVGDPARVLEPADLRTPIRRAGLGGAGSVAEQENAVGDGATAVGAGATAVGDDGTATGWRLRAFGVAPQFRRTGVATDLWRAALDSFPATISSVEGSTRADLAAALAWYGARGFDLDPADPDDATSLAGRACRFTADVDTLRANLRGVARA